LQIRQFGVLLQDSDSDVGRTEIILAQPLPEQIEWSRWGGGAGLRPKCGWNVTVGWQMSRMAGVPTRGIRPERLGEDEAIQGPGSP
jgi:hypothetical protein